MKKNGFTLIELLIVMTVMGILGFIFTDILTQSLRGQNKVKILNQVKQNGQVVLDRLVNEVHQAEKVICAGQYSGKDTLVTFKQGVYYRFRIYPPSGTTQNGYIALDYPLYATNPCLEDQSATERFILTDQDTHSGVSLDYDDTVVEFNSKIFAVDSEAGYSDAVTIRFRATAGVEAGSLYEASVEEGGVLFNTTAQVRTYK